MATLLPCDKEQAKCTMLVIVVRDDNEGDSDSYHQQYMQVTKVASWLAWDRFVAFKWCTICQNISSFGGTRNTLDASVM